MHGKVRRTTLPPIAALCAAIFAFGTSGTKADDPASAPAYVGSEVCAGCHETEARRWHESHHALAWTKPSKENVLADFGDTSFEHDGITTQFTQQNGAFFVTTVGSEGEVRNFDVVGVAGIAPLQQYLLATEEGRLQAFDIAWDVEGRRWYHLYPGADLSPDDGLHWTGPYKNWNARCAECHATGYAKNYDPRSRAYHSAQAEIGVGCEACHGPGEAHIAWAREPAEERPRDWAGLSSRGFTIDLSGTPAETQIQQCAGCHSRREPLSDGSPIPGMPFHDAYRLSLLREGLYHADGSIQDEVYVYGSFLQSKMYARGVRCTDCHDPHTADRKAEANALCAQCHSPAGNPRFPTLKQANYDDPAHHFHPTETEASRCTSCHMIERVYMGIDGRRDHSFRIPRPDLSDVTGAPNACIDCHSDRSNAWAAAEIGRRFRGASPRDPHFSQTIAAARTDPATVADDLLALARHDELPGIIRATALEILRGVADEGAAARAADLVNDKDALVREAAVGVFRALPQSERARRLAPALEDPARSVRIAAAREFLAIPSEILPPSTADPVESAMGEWRASLMAKADFPETQMAIGGTALVLRNPLAAEQAFREAARLDPQLVGAWVMIARILVATGDPGGARAVLETGLAANPTNETLNELHNQLTGAP